MFLYITSFHILIALVQPCFSVRRILNGSLAWGEKRYMVYFVKSRDSPVKYDAWICGGAIVHPSFIVTSAACIEDVKYMYAIAGYRKYVNGLKIYEDPCTSVAKKKIVMTCVPKLYEFDYASVTKWAYLDIAVAQVESPYDFNDNMYVQAGCSYTPNQVDINYDQKYTASGTDAMVLGWGHVDKFRKPEDSTDYNQEYMRYASVLVVNNKICKDNWPADVASFIDKYMLCTSGEGHLNGDGRQIKKTQHLINGCEARKMVCENGECHEVCVSYRRSESTATFEGNVTVNETRRFGFCQNDHGGPLIGWIGGRESLLGIQSAFLVDQNYHCQGPYLYTSTSCNSAFLDCVINKGKLLLAKCDEGPEKLGFTMVERRISWEGHPDGPAANELFEQRKLKSVEKANATNIRYQVPIWR